MNEFQGQLLDILAAIRDTLRQIHVELQELNSHLADMNYLTANKKMIQKEQEKREDDKGFAGDKAALERYIKQKCPNVWANMEEIKQMKSGDFLITFDYVDSNTYQKMAEEVKEVLDGYYSKKYRGFIIPGAGGGKQ